MAIQLHQANHTIVRPITRSFDRNFILQDRRQSSSIDYRGVWLVIDELITRVQLDEIANVRCKD